MKILDRTLEEKPADKGQHRISEIAMERRHRSRTNTTTKAIAHHQVKALAQFLDERPEGAEIVTIISVPHDHESAVCCVDASHQGITISFGRDLRDAGAKRFRDFSGTVGAAVVGDYDLANDAELIQRVPRFLNTTGNRFGFIQARHYDRHFDLAAVARTSIRRNIT